MDVTLNLKKYWVRDLHWENWKYNCKWHGYVQQAPRWHGHLGKAKKLKSNVFKRKILKRVYGNFVFNLKQENGKKGIKL